jgi:hypothetical protein
MRIAILAIAVSLIGCGGGGGSGNPLAQPSFNSSIQPSYPMITLGQLWISIPKALLARAII